MQPTNEQRDAQRYSKIVREWNGTPYRVAHFHSCRRRFAARRRESTCAARLGPESALGRPASRGSGTLRDRELWCGGVSAVASRGAAPAKATGGERRGGTRGILLGGAQPHLPERRQNLLALTPSPRDCLGRNAGTGVAASARTRHGSMPAVTDICSPWPKRRHPRACRLKGPHTSNPGSTKRQCPAPPIVCARMDSARPAIGVRSVGARSVGPATAAIGLGPSSASETEPSYGESGVTSSGHGGYAIPMNP